jgi:hypothetical protein
LKPKLTPGNYQKPLQRKTVSFLLIHRCYLNAVTFIRLKKGLGLGVVGHICNPSTQESEAGRTGIHGYVQKAGTRSMFFTLYKYQFKVD